MENSGQIYAYDSHGARIIDLKTGGKVQKALIRELQWDHLGKELLHIDFARVAADERIKVPVPIELRGVAPGLIAAGLNPVCTDAVAMALMGFDPMMEMGTPPFEVCESIVKLAEDAGLGTRDLKRIEVVGGSIAELKFDFAAIRAQRRKSPRPAPVLRG